MSAKSSGMTSMRVDVGAGLLGELGEQRAGGVLGLAARDGGRDGQDRGAHRLSG